MKSPLVAAAITSMPSGPVPETPVYISTQEISVVKRDGSLVPFDLDRIRVAISKAFQAKSGQIRDLGRTADELAHRVEEQLVKRTGRNLNIEEIQDQVEIILMKAEYYEIAREYIVYREERTRLRELREQTPAKPLPLQVQLRDGSFEVLNWDLVQAALQVACDGLEHVDPKLILEILRKDVYNGIPIEDLRTAQVMAARSLVEGEPGYSYVTARLVLRQLKAEVLPFVCGPNHPVNADTAAPCGSTMYRTYFPLYVYKGIDLELLQPNLADFDLPRLAAALVPERDSNFQFLGLQTLYDRYFLHSEGTRIELPQAFFMRVAMGLAQAEAEPNERAIEFYHLLSSFDFMCSTPTLFNAGTPNPQLSSCFLSTVPDDLDGIFKSIKDNALLSKFSGGLGNDWSQVRGLGAHIKGTNGESQGVIPFLKVANDTAVAVNQGGKRKGAVCAYLETWHVDINEFLDLRKNTGDDRRRTHDMNTACWVPDLFMERVAANDTWTLFSPDEVPDLHDLTGLKFKERYLHYEAEAAAGRIKVFKPIMAQDLWRRMLTMLYETGHPWITFKDACNVRSPQQHAGVVHSSNLCTEITLNSNAEEVAVCNLGSVNLARHIRPHAGMGTMLDMEKLQRTVRTAIRMLDNVIDINFYTIPEAKRSNMRHRPIGLGLMGFQDALYEMKVPYASSQAVEFADRSMEAISYYAIQASSELALERAPYSTYTGSLWSQGILPIDSLDLLDKARNRQLEVDRNSTLDWATLREQVRTDGMRNSNVMAIAPTATIANICGVGPSIEPTFRNLYVKSNMSGDFTVINEFLVRDLKAIDLWDPVMISDLKMHDGSVGPINRVPVALKQLYATAFEMEPSWLIEAGARRQKWLDQSQSLNLYVTGTSGQVLNDLYRLAWKRGLKTTYYLRTQSATQVEKSTLASTDGRLNAVPVAPGPQTLLNIDTAVNPDLGIVCNLDDEDCEACQ